jgi:hypothetical protein
MAIWYAMNVSSFDSLKLISFQPMYGVPQPGTYGQYGFGAYPASPGGAAAGMPPATAGAAAGQTAPGAEVGAVGQTAPAQWTGDPSSYYSNYWGGMCFASTFPCSLELTEIDAS